MAHYPKRRLSALLSLFLAVLLCLGIPLPLSAQAQPSSLRVHFLDVGQADCILIQLPNNQTMLIDGGNQADAKSVARYLTAEKVGTIDYLVATHPHEDHIGGLPSVIGSRTVKTAYLPNVVSTTQTFQDLLTALQSKKIPVVAAKSGVEILSSGDLTIQIVAPWGSAYEDLNNHSAMVKLTYGKTSFLFTGDAEADSEKEIKADIKADVLKVGHHGSDSSTSPAFLKKVSPRYGVISVGKDNSYGHPSNTVVKAMHDLGAAVYRTDEAGTILMTSDGKEITVDKRPTPYQPNAPPKSIAPSTTAPPANNNAQVAQREQEPQSVTVYITNTGKKYHRDGCQYLAKSKHAIPLERAKASYGPCSKCSPPR